MSVVARETVSVAGNRKIEKGRVYPDDHPLVKAYPSFFDSPDEAAVRAQTPTSTAELGERSMSARRVEQATAAPGELRVTSHPCPEEDCDVTKPTAARIAAHHRAKHQ